MKRTTPKFKKVIRLCPICLGNKGEVLYTQNFSLPVDYHLPQSYDVVCCPQCGFVYADTPATQKDYNRFYSQQSKYEDKVTASGGGESAYDKERLERIAGDVDKILSTISLSPKRNSILDIGCANGGLLSAFKKRGYYYLTGLDPSSVCVSNVRGKDIRAFIGGVFPENFQKKNVLNEQFDCVILSSVLEHVCDLRGAMKNILKWLKTGGLVYLEVPDASRYAEFYIVPYYYFDVEHINHFSGNSLKNLAGNQGCQMISCYEKNNAVSNKFFYPVVYLACRKIDGQNKKVTASFDVRNSILKYIKMSEGAKMWPELKKLFQNQKKIIVWGAGNYLFRLLENSPLGKCHIVAFIDNDIKKQNLKIKGIPIHSPLFLKDFGGPIVICSALHGDEIVTQIRKMKVSNHLIYSL